MTKSAVVIAIALILGLTACSNAIPATTLPGNQVLAEALEFEVLNIPLPKEISSPQMEFSGLAWYGDVLVLLPQYPKGIFGYNEGMLYGIQKEELLDWKEDQGRQITSFQIPINDDRVSKTVDGFEGFESLVFIEDRVYLTIESRGGDPMRSFLIKGEVDQRSEEEIYIILDAEQMLELPVQNNVSNASYESITTDGEYLYAIFEQNGIEQNEEPLVLVIDQELNIVNEYPITAGNFRITDASKFDENNEFWVINYFFPGDEHLKVEVDPVSERFGLPESHAYDERIERLIRVRLEHDHFEIIDQPPIYLALLENGEARNWEGLVVFDEIGFLLVTDKFPNSILGLVIMK